MPTSSVAEFRRQSAPTLDEVSRLVWKVWPARQEDLTSWSCLYTVGHRIVAVAWRVGNSGWLVRILPKSVWEPPLSLFGSIPLSSSAKASGVQRCTLFGRHFCCGWDGRLYLRTPGRCWERLDVPYDDLAVALLLERYDKIAAGLDSAAPAHPMGWDVPEVVDVEAMSWV